MVGRAIVIIVVAVVVGVLVLRSGGHPAGLAAPGGTSTTTTAPHQTTTSTTASHAGVKVLVANDSTTNGVAGGYATALRNAGWRVLVPTNAKPPARATSAVYYAANKRADADAVAAAFGLPAADIFPISTATPVANIGGADVVLVVGADLAAKTPPTTIPPPTTTSSTAAHAGHKTTTTTSAHSSSTTG